MKKTLQSCCVGFTWSFQPTPRGLSEKSYNLEKKQSPLSFLTKQARCFSYFANHAMLDMSESHHQPLSNREHMCRRNRFWIATFRLSLHSLLLIFRFPLLLVYQSIKQTRVSRTETGNSRWALSLSCRKNGIRIATYERVSVMTCHVGSCVSCFYNQSQMELLWRTISKWFFRIFNFC